MEFELETRSVGCFLERGHFAASPLHSQWCGSWQPPCSWLGLVLLELVVNPLLLYMCMCVCVCVYARTCARMCSYTAHEDGVGSTAGGRRKADRSQGCGLALRVVDSAHTGVCRRCLSPRLRLLLLPDLSPQVQMPGLRSGPQAAPKLLCCVTGSSLFPQVGGGCQRPTCGAESKSALFYSIPPSLKKL